MNEPVPDPFETLNRPASLSSPRASFTSALHDSLAAAAVLPENHDRILKDLIDRSTTMTTSTTLTPYLGMAPAAGDGSDEDDETTQTDRRRLERRAAPKDATGTETRT